MTTMVNQPASLRSHNLNGFAVYQRESDGYVNATQLCQAAGKRMNNYLRQQNTKDFLAELDAVTPKCATGLVQMVQGGTPELQGTWVHPDVAIDLARWLSPKFGVQVAKWVRELVTKGSVTIGSGDDLLDSMLATQAWCDQIIQNRRQTLALQREVSEVRSIAETADSKATEAIDVATAALKGQTDRHGQFAVMAYSNRFKLSMCRMEAAKHGKNLVAICTALGEPIGKTPDERHYLVNTYPKAVIEAYFVALVRDGKPPSIAHVAEALGR